MDKCIHCVVVVDGGSKSRFPAEKMPFLTEKASSGYVDFPPEDYGGNRGGILLPLVAKAA